MDKFSFNVLVHINYVQLKQALCSEIIQITHREAVRQQHPVSAEHRHAADQHHLLKWSYILQSKRLRWGKSFYCKGNDPLQQNIQWSSRGERRHRPREAGAAKLGATVYPLPLSVWVCSAKQHMHSASRTSCLVLSQTLWCIRFTPGLWSFRNKNHISTPEHRLLASVSNVKEIQTSEHQIINKRTETPWAPLPVCSPY